MVNARLHITCGNCGNGDPNMFDHWVERQAHDLDGERFRDGAYIRCKNCATLHDLSDYLPFRKEKEIITTKERPVMRNVILNKPHPDGGAYIERVGEHSFRAGSSEETAIGFDSGNAVYDFYKRRADDGDKTAWEICYAIQDHLGVM